MIKLRKVEYSDIDLLYRWANDPIVRKNSFNSAPISFDAHKDWFNKMMDDPSVFQFILMDENTPVGQIRLNINGEDAEIGYSVASEYRGRGYGHKLLQLLVCLVKEDYPQIKRLIAKVKPENSVSKEWVEKEG